MADGIETYQDGEEISFRQYYEKYSVFVRQVTTLTKRVSWKSVGYESFQAADTFAATTSAIAGNSDVRVVPVGGGLHDVTWTATTVQTVRGDWYIPSPFSPTPST